MKIIVKRSPITHALCDLLVMYVFEEALMRRKEKIVLGGEGGVVNSALNNFVAEELVHEGIKGKLGETFVLHTHGKIAAKKVAVIGMGKKSECTIETVRRIGAYTIKLAKKHNAKEIAAVFPEIIAKKLPPREAAQAFAEGAQLANYEYAVYRGEEYKKEAARRAIQVLSVLENNSKKVPAIETGIRHANIAVAATSYARDLVNEPASLMTPAHLVAHAREITRKSKGRIKINVFDRRECKRRGMGAFLAVAQGASEEPYFVHLTYRGKSKKKKIALVGKAITFDSGGLQIKPDTAMETMKLDMSGAAALLGIFSVLCELNLPYEIHGIFAATENMPGGRAYKPGDIVRAMNGKTIEIIHTDAEGRVTLADSLSFAASLKPNCIIDFATLTGACMVALGEEVGGLFSNNTKLGAQICTAAAKSGERFWELPMVSEYRDFIKSPVADMRNSGKTRYGGAITAALFLEEFVGDTPWVHLDIAGPAWAERELLPYVPMGGSGFATRTILEFLKNI